MVLVDAKGAPSKITMLRPSESNKGLGYHMAVDGNQREEFATRSTKVEHTCVAAENYRMNYTEAKQLLEQRLLAQTKYGLTLSQFDQNQCQKLSVRINRAFLPKMHINRNIWSKAMGGPWSKYGHILSSGPVRGNILDTSIEMG